MVRSFRTFSFHTNIFLLFKKLSRSSIILASFQMFLFLISSNLFRSSSLMFLITFDIWFCTSLLIFRSLKSFCGIVFHNFLQATKPDSASSILSQVSDKSFICSGVSLGFLESSSDISLKVCLVFSISMFDFSGL